MRTLFFSLVSLFISILAIGQRQKNIEIDLKGRYDRHADYTSRYFGRTYTNDTRLWGKSFGFNFNYIHPVRKNIKLKTGIGYYRLGIDKIRQTTPFGIIATARNIDYEHPSGIQPLFSTSEYHYNNLAFTGGLIYENKVFKKWKYNIGADFRYLYSFSQLYHINYDNIKYKTNTGRSLGFGINSSIGVSKDLLRGKYYINPKFIIPIFQNLNGDPEFGEDTNVKMRKWFNGTGISLSIGKYLK